MVRRLHHLGIVLDYQNGVPQVAQLVQDADQPGCIARVQSDRRLVQHVAGADQPRAEARSELDPLRFAAR